MNVGSALLDLCLAKGARSTVVVGTGKNVGKTVVVGALCDALTRRAIRFGISSMGRDGEAVDAVDAIPKPRFFLRRGTLLATALGALPRSPACEMLEISKTLTALGPVTFVVVAEPAYFELVGGPTAMGMRAVKRRLVEFGAQHVVVDGAVDRLAAIAGEDDAITVATGAANATTPQRAIEDVAALVAQLQIHAYDPHQAHIRIAGALTPARAAAFAAAGEARQIVVRDATQIMVRGKALLAILERLDLRCERPLRVAAVSVASIGRDRSFEPREFACAVAKATKLPTFDAYAGTMDVA